MLIILLWSSMGGACFTHAFHFHERMLDFFLTGFLVVFILAWTSPAGAQDARAQHEKDKQKGLLGSWSVTVTPTATSVCGGPALPSPPPFTELVTFSGGGGFQETNTN